MEEKGRRNKGKVQREEKEERGMLNGLYKCSFAKSIHPCGVLSQDEGRLATLCLVLMIKEQESWGKQGVCSLSHDIRLKQFSDLCQKNMSQVRNFCSL